MSAPTHHHPPGRVGPDALRLRSETEDGGFKVGVAIDAASHGSEVLLGLEWIKPGTEVVSWDADERSHEVYYVATGKLRITWSGDDAGEELLGPGDSFYFPPARTYGLENTGDDEVFIVWSITPSP